MMRWWSLPALLLVAAGCGGGDDEISLRRPQILAALDAADVYATARVCRKPGCSDPVKEQRFDQVGDRFTTTLRLWAGTYHLTVSFATDAVAEAVPLPLAAYPELLLIVAARTDTPVVLDESTLQTAFDFDGDGISNLDEVRFDFRPATPDGDTGADRELVLVTSRPVSAHIGSDSSTVAEAPAHDAPIDRAFHIDRFEVSARRYRRCVAARVCVPPHGVERDVYLAADEHLGWPATGMRREDAAQFCRSVGGELPNEFEWEYAARANTGWAYPWGDDLATDETSCYLVNARYPLEGGGSRTCNPVNGSTPQLVDVNAYQDCSSGGRCYANACSRNADSGANNGGPCQMAGNAWEWTASDFNSYTDPEQALGAPGLVVIRGGSADSLEFSLRSTFRFGVDPTLEDNPELARLIGFRCIYPD